MRKDLKGDSATDTGTGGFVAADGASAMLTVYRVTRPAPAAVGNGNDDFIITIFEQIAEIVFIPGRVTAAVSSRNTIAENFTAPDGRSDGDPGTAV